MSANMRWMGGKWEGKMRSDVSPQINYQCCIQKLVRLQLNACTTHFVYCTFIFLYKKSTNDEVQHYIVNARRRLGNRNTQEESHWNHNNDDEKQKYYCHFRRVGFVRFLMRLPVRRIICIWSVWCGQRIRFWIIIVKHKTEFLRDSLVSIITIIHTQTSPLVEGNVNSIMRMCT